MTGACEEAYFKDERKRLLSFITWSPTGTETSLTLERANEWSGRV